MIVPEPFALTLIYSSLSIHKNTPGNIFGHGTKGYSLLLKGYSTLGWILLSQRDFQGLRQSSRSWPNLS